MDSSLRRVYFSIAVVLILLWAGMFAWAITTLKPEILSAVSAPAPSKNSLELFPSLHIPGIQFSVYHTLPGDTFVGLAQRFNLLETTLRSLNQFNDERQPPADSRLLVPSKDGIFHVARTGQGLTDIAKAYGIPLKAILSANKKKDDHDLQDDDILYLPGANYLSRSANQWICLSALEIHKGFLKPTTGRFADGFGERMHPLTHRLTFHEGLDLAPGWRARVVASQDGRVLFAGMRAGYGRLIIIDHGGDLTSWYAHLDEILVKSQQRVHRGDLIGKVGKSGRTTGPHLHFEVRLSNVPQNPLLYLVQ